MKTVVITGGAKGIGAALCRTFAKHSYNVLINYNTSKEKAEKLAEEIGAKTFCADVSDTESAKRLIQYAIKTFGGIDVLINNAGISERKLFSDITEEDWDRMFLVNTKSVYNTCHACMEHFIHKKQGKIINISSMWGQVGASCEVHYSASKAAVIGFTKALAQELAPSGITVNAIAPGAIDTDMMHDLTEEEIKDFCEETPLGRLGKPDEIADAAIYLANADFVTGQILGINGGIVI